MNKKIALLVAGLAVLLWVSKEVRGDFVSMRSVAFDEFYIFLKEQGISPTLFNGPFLDISNEKYLVFNWYHTAPAKADTVSVTIHVPVYFSSFRADIGGNGDFKGLINK